ncbi:MAG TPA: PAS domain S-box protein [Gemmata sp.]|nr:PAS domain S-box protein [Gemmata sp.]
MIANIQELMQTLFEEAGDALFLFKPENGRVVEVNPMAQLLSGMTRPALLEETVDALFRSESPGGSARLRRVYQNTVSFHSQDGFFLRQRTKGGWVPVNLTVARLHVKPKTLGLITARDVSERRRSETALRESETLKRSILDSALDCIITMDHEGTIIEFNPAAERVFGYSREKAVGQRLAQLIVPPASRAAYARGIAHYLNTGEGPILDRRIEVTALRADGTEFPIELTITAIRIKEKPVFTAFIRDVTERKRAEIAQGERVKLASLVGDIGVALTQGDSMKAMLGLCANAMVRHLDAASARIWTVDEAGEVLELQASSGNDTHNDDAHTRIPIEWSRIGLIAKERRPHVTNAAIGDPRVCDQEWASREGMVAFAGHPLLVADRLVGVVALFARHNLSDATLDAFAGVAGQIALGIDRQRAQDAVRESEGRFRALIEKSFDGILLLDREGVISYASPSATRIMGYPREEFIGRSFSELVAPEDLNEHNESHRQSIGELGASATSCNRYGHKDGNWRWLEVRSTNLFAEPGVWAKVINFRDVTERRQLEEQFRHSQKMEAVGQLAGGVAHDFNNLLTIINGYSNLLLQSIPPGDSSRESLEEIHKAGERSAELTRQLLAFSRQQVLAPRILNLNAVMANAEKLLRRAIGEDVTLIAILDPNLGSVRADPGQVEQILLNLAVNARDAMPTGGRLTIETRNVELNGEYVASHPDAQSGSHVQMVVTDTGCGMAPEAKARIFEPFFTTKGPGKGTGLGLATVYGIVRQSGGCIGVDTKVGVGTTFNIYLPRVDMPVATTKPRSGPQAPPRGTETVLLVEDEDGVRALTRYVLTRCGYNVLEAAEGIEAVQVAGGHPDPIHLLISDVVMPGVGGRVVADRVTELHPEAHVLFVSGYTDDAVVRHGVSQERVNFLQKPFSPIALAHKVRDILDSLP